jgi:hypothetical protein
VHSNADKIKQLIAAQKKGFSLGQAFYKDSNIYHSIPQFLGVDIKFSHNYAACA